MNTPRPKNLQIDTACWDYGNGHGVSITVAINNYRWRGAVRYAGKPSAEMIDVGTDLLLRQFWRRLGAF